MFQGSPERQDNLGTPQNPGTTCNDIKRNGPVGAKSGTFTIDTRGKGKQTVYCDMETQDGGWTLFFNYKHGRGTDLHLKDDVYL